VKKTTGFLLAGLFVALLLAGVASNFASSSPDGLDATSYRGCTRNAAGEITGGTCIAQGTKDHEVAASPFADYGIAGFDNPYLSTGLSGVLGVLVTFGVAGGLFRLTRGRRRATPAGVVPAPRTAGSTAAHRVGAE
jgi:cobalt/nickel transport protein